jgi:transposase-like protein
MTERSAATSTLSYVALIEPIARAAGKYSKERAKKLTHDDVKTVLEMVDSGVPKAEIARAYGVSRETLYVYLRARVAARAAQLDNAIIDFRKVRRDRNNRRAHHKQSRALLGDSNESEIRNYHWLCTCVVDRFLVRSGTNQMLNGLARQQHVPR